MASATLYLHIGTPKTGTTALQSFLAQNVGALKKHGVLNPGNPAEDARVRWPKVGVNRTAHFLTRREGEYDPALAPVCFQKIRAQLSEDPSLTKAVLTDEGLWRYGSEYDDFWEKLLEELRRNDMDLKVVIYLRRQDDFLYSCWGQTVKSGATWTFEEFIPHAGEAPMVRTLDYYQALKQIERHIGKENLIVRLYQKSSYRGKAENIQSDFLACMGLELTDDFVWSDELKNTSLTDCVVETRRLLNYQPKFAQPKHYVNDLLRKAQESLRADGRLQVRKAMSAELSEKIMAECMESNRKIAEEYFNAAGESAALKQNEGKVPKTLFEVPKADTAKSASEISASAQQSVQGAVPEQSTASTSATPFSQEEMVGVCGEVIDSLYQENQRLKKQLKESAAPQSTWKKALRALKGSRS